MRALGTHVDEKGGTSQKTFEKFFRGHKHYFQYNGKHCNVKNTYYEYET